MPDATCLNKFLGKVSRNNYLILTCIFGKGHLSTLGASRDEILILLLTCMSH